MISKNRTVTFSIFRALLVVAALFLGALTACTSTKSLTTAPQITNDSDFIPGEFTWQPVTQGIDRFDFENALVPLIYHVVKIDLSNENLELICYPDEHTKISSSGTFAGLKTQDFAQGNNCTVAINASPFDGRFRNKKIIGVHSANGRQLAAPNNRYAAIAFSNAPDSNGYIAHIIKNQSADCAENFDFVFGGFFAILIDGELLPYNEIYNSRTGAGISQDGKTLYLLVVEGEEPARSSGLTYPQCGKIFAAMGCTNALEFDGGGSSQLCINGTSVLNYKTSRIQANSFGFKTNPEGK
jgi:hypothetical protein